MEGAEKPIGTGFVPMDVHQFQVELVNGKSLDFDALCKTGPCQMGIAREGVGSVVKLNAKRSTAATVDAIAAHIVDCGAMVVAVSSTTIEVQRVVPGKM